MARGLSPEFRIMGVIAILFGILSLLLIMTLQPIHPKILAVMMKYIWLFIGGAIVITAALSRIFDIFSTKDKELN